MSFYIPNTHIQLYWHFLVYYLDLNGKLLSHRKKNNSEQIKFGVKISRFVEYRIHENM